jgi:hypothetical protein
MMPLLKKNKRHIRQRAIGIGLRILSETQNMSTTRIIQME